MQLVEESLIGLLLLAPGLYGGRGAILGLALVLPHPGQLPVGGPVVLEPPGWSWNDNFKKSLPSLSSPLFSGRLTPLAVLHALTGLACGVIAAKRHYLQSCQMWSILPHMWALAAEAMGFRVNTMAWLDSSFAKLMKAHSVAARVLPHP